jgi:predicted transcriptional regulator
LARSGSDSEYRKNREVKTISTNDNLLECLKIMQQNDYSQLPAYDDHDECLGLLTGNVISRWFAAHVNDTGEIIEDMSHARIVDVMKYKEEIDIPYFIRYRQ